MRVSSSWLARLGIPPGVDPTIGEDDGSVTASESLFVLEKDEPEMLAEDT
jgi:hypothetical protein